MDGSVVIITLSIAFVGLAVLYSLALLWLGAGFRLVTRDHRSATPSDLSVSVIVAARNEADNITACLQSILANDYHRFEVIVVDDGSTDATANLAEDVARHDSAECVSVIRLEDSSTTVTGHKKLAIQTGIGQSRGDVIVTTDADVIVPRDWLSKLIGSFREGVEFVSGPIAYSEGPGFLSRAVALEMLGLVAAGAGAIGVGHPMMCNGANLAYRRKTFDRVGGFQSIDHVATGDDTLLMFKVASENRRAVRFCADPEAIIVTNSASNWSEFVQQRIRWSSQGLDHGDFGTVVLAVLVWTFHALLLAGMAAAFFTPSFWWPVTVALVLKIVSEGLLLHSACRHFGRRHLMKVFLPAEVIQIPYVVAVGFLGVFGSGFSWKGRRLER